MNIVKRRSIEFWLVVLGLCAVFFLAINPIADFDTGYHLKNGQYILESHTIPRADIFSYSASGASWVNHYWLSDVIFFLVYHSVGWRGLTFFIALLAALTYALLLKTARLMGAPPLLSLVLLFPVAYLTLELWVVRPQVFSYLCAVLLIYLLERRHTLRNRYLAFFIPAVMLIWANMHAGVLLGLVVLCIYEGATIIANHFRLKPMGFFLFASSLSFIVVFANPNGYSTLAYASIIAPAVKELGVMEWGSLLQFLTTWQAKLFFMEMLVVTAFLAWRVAIKKDVTLALRGLGVVGLAFVLPLVSVRHVGFFPLLILPLLAREVYELFEERRGFAMDKDVVRYCIAAALVLVCVFAYQKDTAQAVVNTHLLPVRAGDFIATTGLQGPMFDIPAQGGQLIFRLWPEQKVFMDGRSEIYKDEVDKDFLAIMKQQPGWEKLVNEKYKFNYFVLWYREPLAAPTRNLALRLMRDFNFILVQWDDATIILVRNVPQNASIIAAHQYHIINPFIDSSLIRDEYIKDAARETQRALDEAPDSSVMHAYAQGILLRLRGR